MEINLFNFEIQEQMQRSKDILKKFWGFDTFRPLQEEIINDAIYGHDTLALLPTGAGKSICFQVPGLSREGVTVVISPLISLMQDQVDNLKKKGIRAAAIISGMTFKEIDITLDNACFGGLDFLYTSPERIQSDLFIERFKRMKVALLVVDEAHCISEWGHDFRPSFKSIFQLREIHPELPIIALTATATERVKNDIITHLRLKLPKIHEGSYERNNLSYNVQKTTNKQRALLDYCLSNQGISGIVYCQTRKSVKEIAKLLQVNQVKVGIYHGGMSKEDRHIMLTEWMKDSIHVMVATNAFGMGIDKPSVRFVLHYEFPTSLEAYFQEAGRAGRDGAEAYAVAYFEQNDIEELEQKIIAQFPPLDQVKNCYRALCNFLKIAIGSGKNETYPFDLKRMIHNFNLEPIQTYNALKLLELNGDIVFSEGVFHPTKIKFSVGARELYNFQVKHDKFYPLTAMLSRSYPGIHEFFFAIDEKEVSNRLKIGKNELTKLLQELEKYGILDVSWASSLPTITFPHERLPDDYLQLNPAVYADRKEFAFSKLAAAVNFLETKDCRSQFVIRYFGQHVQQCGKCDRCLEITYSGTDLETQLLGLLRTPRKFNELQETLQFNSEELKIELRKLLLQEAIQEKDGFFFIP